MDECKPLLPDLCSKFQLAACFREANFGSKSDGDTTHDRTRLSFPEFEDCIARCALRVYGYQLPLSPEAEPGTCCSPRQRMHRMPFDSINEGSEKVG